MKRFRIPVDFRQILPFVLLFVALAVVMPRSAKFGYEYKKGSSWDYEDLTAQFNFPLLKSAEQMQADRERQSATAIPYFRCSQDVSARATRAVESMDFGASSSLKQTVVEAVKSIYAHGVIDDNAFKSSKGPSSVGVIYVQKGKRATKVPETEVYRLSDAKEKLREYVASRTKANADSILRANSVYDLVVPDLTYDSKTTELVHAEANAEPSPTSGFVTAGELIVKKGELVTEEIAQELDSYKAEYEASMGYGGSRWLIWLGNILLAMILSGLLYLSVMLTDKKLLQQRNRLWVLVLVVTIATCVSLLVARFSPQALFMVPMTLVTIWLVPFFRNRVILPAYVICLLPLLIFAKAGMELFVIFLAAGIVSTFSFKYLNRGWLQFVTSIIAFCAMLLVYFAFRMIDVDNGNLPLTVLYLLIGALLSVAGYPLVFLLEKAFNLVSASRLHELLDTSNRLLRELEANAPGTYQHSVQVMGMAEAAARAIGADHLLIQAGALYHDIGKMSDPMCFIENETVMRRDALEPGYHDGLTYKESARRIISHVKSGLQIAERAKLPQEVKDFIMTHHGDSCTAYFYTKFVNEGGDPADVADFTYPGRKPTTREQVVLMLCDSIEAASRTIGATTAEEYSRFVEKMVAAKIDTGQLNDADISVKELIIVKEAIKSYLTQLHHERVAYPQASR